MKFYFDGKTEYLRIRKNRIRTVREKEEIRKKFQTQLSQEKNYIKKLNILTRMQIQLTKISEGKLF